MYHHVHVNLSPQMSAWCHAANCHHCMMFAWCHAANCHHWCLRGVMQPIVITDVCVVSCSQLSSLMSAWRHVANLTHDTVSFSQQTYAARKVYGWESLQLGKSTAGKVYSWESLRLGKSTAGKFYCWEILRLGKSTAGKFYGWEYQGTWRKKYFKEKFPFVKKIVILEYVSINMRIKK